MKRSEISLAIVIVVIAIVIRATLMTAIAFGSSFSSPAFPSLLAGMGDKGEKRRRRREADLSPQDPRSPPPHKSRRRAELEDGELPGEEGAPSVDTSFSAGSSGPQGPPPKAPRPQGLFTPRPPLQAPPAALQAAAPRGRFDRASQSYVSYEGAQSKARGTKAGPPSSGGGQANSAEARPSSGSGKGYSAEAKASSGGGHMSIWYQGYSAEARAKAAAALADSAARNPDNLPAAAAALADSAAGLAQSLRRPRAGEGAASFPSSPSLTSPAAGEVESEPLQEFVQDDGYGVHAEPMQEPMEPDAMATRRNSYNITMRIIDMSVMM